MQLINLILMLTKKQDKRVTKTSYNNKFAKEMLLGKKKSQFIILRLISMNQVSEELLNKLKLTNK